MNPVSFLVTSLENNAFVVYGVLMVTFIILMKFNKNRAARRINRVDRNERQIENDSIKGKYKI